MTGPEHYQEAERLLPVARELIDNAQDELAMPVIAAAQVHATLALAAATAFQMSGFPDYEAWRSVAQKGVTS